MMTKIEVGEGDVLLVVDVQNDFCPGGALAVPHGDEVVPLVNRLARALPARGADAGLAPDRPPVVRLRASRPQAVRDDRASPTGRRSCGRIIACRARRAPQFPAICDIPHAELVLRKGYRRDIDSYSAFYENDHTTPTGLAGYLRERGLTRVFLAGLALDFCVRYSAEDAHREGFAVWWSRMPAAASTSTARSRRPAATLPRWGSRRSTTPRWLEPTRWAMAQRRAPATAPSISSGSGSPGRRRARSRSSSPRTGCRRSSSRPRRRSSPSCRRRPCRPPGGTP